MGYITVMTTQEIIKIIAAVSAFICIVTGIVAMFRGIKADGVIKLSGLAKGEIKSGSGGVLLLFFGAIIFISLIIKGEKTEKVTDKDGNIIKENSIRY